MKFVELPSEIHYKILEVTEKKTLSHTCRTLSQPALETFYRILNISSQQIPLYDKQFPLLVKEHQGQQIAYGYYVNILKINDYNLGSRLQPTTTYSLHIFGSFYHIYQN